MSCPLSCHVMSCLIPVPVMSCPRSCPWSGRVMSCHVISPVRSCHVMSPVMSRPRSCHVPAPVMSCHIPCRVMSKKLKFLRTFLCVPYFKNLIGGCLCLWAKAPISFGGQIYIFLAVIHLLHITECSKWLNRIGNTGKRLRRGQNYRGW